MDETPVKILKLNHTGKDGQGYMWLALGGSVGYRSARYRFAPGRGSIHASSFLGSYAGLVQTDGYKAYDSIAAVAQWTHVGCWAQARRKFFDANKVALSALTTDALGRIKKLYKLDHEFRDKKLESNEFLVYRRDLIQPFLDEFKAWNQKTIAQVLPAGET